VSKQTVYLVTDSEYSDYRVCGVFSTEEKAKRAQEFWNTDNTIEEYEIDCEFPDTRELNLWQVAMDSSGCTPSGHYGPFRISNDSVVFEDRPSMGGDFMSFMVWAKDKSHALKIANERRLRHIAEGTWNTDWNKWRQEYVARAGKKTGGAE